MRPSRIILSTLLFIFGCSGGDTVDLDGFLVPTDAGTPPTTANIGVAGRNADEFPVEIKSSSSVAGTLEFRIEGLPNDESLMFQVAGGGLDAITTFPISMSSTNSLRLPAVPQSTISTIINQAETTFLPGGVNLSRAIIVGIVNPSGLSTPPFINVQLVGQNDTCGDLSASPPGDGPFYFTESGVVTNTNQFLDSEGTYIIFNVSAGAYRVCFNDGTTGQPTEYDIVALDGEVIFGFDIPLFTTQ